MWEISVSIVKDFLSPEVLEKYGPRFEVVTPLEEPVVEEEGEEEEEHVIIEAREHRVSFRASLASAGDDSEVEEVCWGVRRIIIRQCISSHRSKFLLTE